MHHGPNPTSYNLPGHNPWKIPRQYSQIFDITKSKVRLNAISLPTHQLARQTARLPSRQPARVFVRQPANQFTRPTSQSSVCLSSTSPLTNPFHNPYIHVPTRQPTYQLFACPPPRYNPPGQFVRQSSRNPTIRPVDRTPVCLPAVHMLAISLLIPSAYSVLVWPMTSVRSRELVASQGDVVLSQGGSCLVAYVRGFCQRDSFQGGYSSTFVWIIVSVNWWKINSYRFFPYRDTKATCLPLWVGRGYILSAWHL